MISNRSAKWVIAILSIAVIGLVALMYTGFGLRDTFDAQYPNFDKSILPWINALMNCLVYILLLFAYRAIRKLNVKVHRRFIFCAAILSTLFLLNYVFYHMISDSTKYGGDGIVRIVYFVILLTHILLAIISFPFILYTAFLGHTMQVASHRKLARFVFPVWLYVALTGVLVYLLISPYYPSAQ